MQEFADYFGVHYMTVSRAVRRWERRLLECETLQNTERVTRTRNQVDAGTSWDYGINDTRSIEENSVMENANQSCPFITPPHWAACLTLCLIIVLGVTGPANADSPYSALYSKCIIDKMQGAQTNAAAVRIASACKELTTPKKCRGDAFKENRNLTGRFVPITEEEFKQFKQLEKPEKTYEYIDIHAQCISECSNASWFSKIFGECSTDY